MIKFEHDQIVVPKESEYFALVDKDGETIIPVERSGEFWDNDLIGLRTLHEERKLFYYEAPEGHDQLTCIDRIHSIVPMLLGKLGEAEANRVLRRGGSIGEKVIKVGRSTLQGDPKGTEREQILV
eukprot:gnl/TRDRNA2_/TRDRNA2_137356_c0_seq1.p2 gnl/TRDRNA2_/TRDRNA2_137356_c0~~gnl/TRDRNA2_/TRDRNA2_137356_c0_seq1.p2  ORF type:complete len:125 (+),score=17.65 gnl/TRDRNA2_/TRDRNA2_137356_c0_seq1:680-1054(+)